MADDVQNCTQPLEDDSKDGSWGNLIAKSAGLANQKLKEHQVVIGRKPPSTIIINDPRLSGVHCSITYENGRAFIEDKSTNGTFLENSKLSKGAKLELNHGNTIWLLHQSQVKVGETMGYQIELTAKLQQLAQKKSKIEQNELKRKEEEMAAEMSRKADQGKLKLEEQMKKIEEEKKKLAEQSKDLFKSILQQITCCICLQIMYLPVTVHPCNHRFCGACLSGIIKAKNQNCAQCRKEITTAQRDSNFNSLIEDYLKAHPEEKRSKEDMAMCDSANIFDYAAVDIKEVIHGKRVQPARRRGSRARVAPARRARGSSPALSAGSSDSDTGVCYECTHTRNGFRCPPGQTHRSCLTCAKMIAIRPGLDQECLLCTQVFCNLYFPPCSAFGVKLGRVEDRAGEVRIDDVLFRGNNFEFNIMKNYMQQKKLNSRNIFDRILADEMDKDKFRYIVDKKIMKIPPIASREVTVQRRSPVCDICWTSLWFQMVLTFRWSIQTELPSSVQSRPDCYYGMNCSTMTHKADHARKLNHACFQTRF